MPWYYAGPEAKPVGPVSLEELRSLRYSGTISPETYIIEQTGKASEALAWKRYQDVFPSLPSLPPIPHLAPPPAPALTPPPPVAPPAPAVQPHPLFPSATPVVTHHPVFPPGARPDPYYTVKPTNMYCAWGFGLSLAGIFFAFACGIGILPALISLPLCVIGIAQVQRHREQSGQWLAISGLVLSTLALIVSLFFIVWLAMPILKAHGLTVTEETTNDSE